MRWKSKYSTSISGVISAPPPIPNKPVKIPIKNVVTKANKGGTL